MMLMGGGYPGSYFLDYGAAPPSLELALGVTDLSDVRYLVFDAGAGRYLVYDASGHCYGVADV
jgi:hypothetical protein